MTDEPFQVTERGDPRDRIANQRPLAIGAAGFGPHVPRSVRDGWELAAEAEKQRIIRERSTEMATETTDMLRVATAEELEQLQQARVALEAIEARAVMLAWETTKAAVQDGRQDFSATSTHSWGRLAEACSIAENVVFNVLNVASSHCHVSEAEDILRASMENRLDKLDPPAPTVDDEPDYLHDTRDEHDERL